MKIWTRAENDTSQNRLARLRVFSLAVLPSQASLASGSSADGTRRLVQEDLPNGIAWGSVRKEQPAANHRAGESGSWPNSTFIAVASHHLLPCSTCGQVNLSISVEDSSNLEPGREVGRRLEDRQFWGHAEQQHLFVLPLTLFPQRIEEGGG